MTTRRYHFCAEFHIGLGSAHVAEGLVTIEGDPFDQEHYPRIREGIASHMEPKRPAEKIVVRSLSLIAEKP